MKNMKFLSTVVQKMKTKTPKKKRGENFSVNHKGILSTC